MTANRSRVAWAITVQGIVGLAVMDAMLFAAAGSFRWRAPWILTAMLAVYFAAGGAWFVYNDPDLLAERMARRPDVPQWDRPIKAGYRLMVVALFVTAGLDARFHLSRMPEALRLVGALGIVASSLTIWWCTSANHFLSSEVRIQHDRGHRVVRDGPYRYVRHPMYASLIVLMTSMALMLGSWLAVVPAAVIAVLFVVRTVFEDRLLRSELDGYAEYVREVRGRLLPGVW